MNRRLATLAAVTSAVLLAGPVASRLDNDRLLRDPGPAPAGAPTSLIPPAVVADGALSDVGAWIQLGTGSAAVVALYVAGIGCQEDEPCWDCATMGNRICGVEP